MTPATTSRPTRRIRSRGGCLAASLAIIVEGLSLRFVPLGLPIGIVEYGGSALWAAMVYALVAALLPHRNGRTILLVAGAIALVVELSRLVHTPWLDAFRLTLPGALLLGRIFSPWNLVAYAAGLAASALVDRRADLRAKGG
ncbi:DUF2809 domain-containing protein [Methylobacterium sp. Leaf93]|uniref:ribosomal maturation YjgA family protein n=1 Tax=Methylobacterium sp. Leaf93 TaxID=1736249 RepID=UPI0006FCD306|nr:DUF2809 domain-containing protein [Methylobacterium sp. Leaf93]KQP05414.1 hypothetical protein ASF26_08195 [Methylobacterium sp. Leaf93]